MRDLNVLAVAISAVIAFVISGAWYGLLGGQLSTLKPAYAEARPQLLTVVVELARNLMVALVIAVLVTQLGIDGLLPGLALGAALWIGFPVVVLAGSVYHEHAPVALAAIHAGDWLLKLLASAMITTVWRG